ncbi:MAG: glycosyltransferase [Gammaproteobacteria bacterium]|nr:glycosyltransferase [Gammaproteobacteria bacterium]
MRRLSRLVAYCLPYEFEDSIVALSDAKLLVPEDWAGLETSRRIYRLLRTGSGSPALARMLSPRRHAREAPEGDLFIAVLNDTWDAYVLSTMRGWRERHTHAACFVSEAWAHLMPPDYLLELLQPFDEIFVGTHHVADALQTRIGRPCSYLPLASDVLRFAPTVPPSARCIDVCNIGRRSALTHEALLQYADQTRSLYYYDTAIASGHGRSFQVEDARQHRLLLASLLKRSRYFIANRARINDPVYSSRVHEISGRFFEGAAAGTVMLGMPADSANYRVQFSWPDAVVELPFDCPDIGQRIAELDQDRSRLARIRRDNVMNSARRHDWSHRLRSIFDRFGLAPTDAMLMREQALEKLALAAENGELELAG